MHVTIFIIDFQRWSHLPCYNGGDDNCDEMQCEWMIEVVIFTPKSKDMIMVIVKSGNGSKLSIWGFSCHLPLLIVGSNKRWISMAKTNWGLSHCPSTFHKSVSFYHIRKDCFDLFWGLKVNIMYVAQWIEFFCACDNVVHIGNFFCWK